jgi:hypothetical protein
VKKTDPNDARNLALYLEKDLLPEGRMKDKTQAQLASLTQTPDTLVKLWTSSNKALPTIRSRAIGECCAVGRTAGTTNSWTAL